MTIDLRRRALFRAAVPRVPGWVGFRLDVGAVDWDEASELLVESYCLCAPKKLAAAVTP
ncbi:MAG TPA: hypothetical protein VNU75_13780 [Acidimicrobiales bacterium]|nr:hypothetical protein [Acidimicrobiales bacterium]